jgi:hypothetical protein
MPEKTDNFGHQVMCSPRNPSQESYIFYEIPVASKMKILPITFACCLSLLFTGCGKESYVKFEIISGGCGTISFQDHIGPDFSAALDSLISLRESFIGDDYSTEEVNMEIEFHDDNRIFKGIKFIRASNQALLFSMSDVLDSKGNYYLINWCPD